MSRRTLKKFFGPIILSEASEQLLTDRLHIRRAIYYYIQAKGPSEGEFQGTQGEVWGREKRSNLPDCVWSRAIDAIAYSSYINGN